MSGTDKIQAWVEGGVGWLVFNQPERRNAISQDMWSTLVDVLGDFGRDDAVRVIVMRGAGETAFVSGGDISEFEEKVSGVSANADVRAAFQQASDRGMEAFQGVEKPLIALIHGYCFGGGVLIALQADMRIVSEEAKFSIPAGRLGIGYPFPHVRRLAQLVGPSAAADILFTARVFDAAEAKALGLVNRVVPRADLDPTVAEVVASIARNAPLTIRAAKAALRAFADDPTVQEPASVQALIDACIASQDFLEGSRAFIEKRRPKFTGR